MSTAVKGATTVVVCAGDSITRGQFGGNYVDRLSEALTPDGYRFVNAGVNGDMAYNVVQRLADVVAADPDVVTVLVGTNDVNARFSEKVERRYRRGGGIPVSPSLAWYRENVDIIVTRLKAETRARVVLVEIPMLGEDLSSRMNDLVREYNATLATLASAHRVPLLPLFDRLTALIPKDHRPPPYEAKLIASVKALAQHRVLRRKWDDISRRNGLTLTFDHIHLNDRGADVVAELIGEHLSVPAR